MSEGSAEKKKRMAETVRLVVTRREQAPRSPRMQRALKRLIWRYTRPVHDREEGAETPESHSGPG